MCQQEELDITAVEATPIISLSRRLDISHMLRVLDPKFLLQYIMMAVPTHAKLHLVVDVTAGRVAVTRTFFSPKMASPKISVHQYRLDGLAFSFHDVEK